MAMIFEDSVRPAMSFSSPSQDSLGMDDAMFDLDSFDLGLLDSPRSRKSSLLPTTTTTKSLTIISLQQLF